MTIRALSSIFTLAVALGVAATSATAFADDGKTYPGIGCNPYTDSDEFQRSGSSIENTSSSYSLLLFCPVIKDNVAGTTGTNFVRISYTKIDSTGFYCAIYGREADGGGSYTASTWDFNAAGTKNMALSNISSYGSGSYTLYCILPPGAKLHSYRVDEN